MVIGFTQRFRTVSESDVMEGEDLFTIYIDVATLTTAEREHPMEFRLQSGGTAIVEPGNDVQNQLFDAIFGVRLEPGASIEEGFILESLVATIPPLQAHIRDDLRSEEKECFTIRMFSLDVSGRRELFVCNEDESGATNYFCETTICILDNDGMFSSKFFSDLFM